MIQDLATFAVVAGAFGYLVWKLGIAPRLRKRPRRPDVPLRRLSRPRR